VTATLADVDQAREQVIRAALRTLMAERGLTDDDRAAANVTDTSAALALAARDLVTAYELLPMGQRPKGWAA
jgi:hypothetical protein